MGAIHWIILCLTLLNHGCTAAYSHSRDCPTTIRVTSTVQTVWTTFLYSGDCSMPFEAPPGMRVRVKLRYARFAIQEGCETAQTDIYDRDGPNKPERHIAKWCGESHSTFTSWSNYMKVHAHDLFNGPLEIDYSAVNDTQCIHKRRVREGKVATIKSEGYPEKYERNTECRWEIDTLSQYNNNQTVTLSFDVDLSDSPNCLSDYIRVYYESTPSPDVEVALLCGKQVKTYTLYIKFILIVLKTGNEEAGTGFKLLYHAKNDSPCNKTLTARSRTPSLLTSENYPTFYPSFQRCTYLIQRISPIMNIRLKVVDSHLGSYCQDEYVLVYDGKTEESPLLGKWCGSAKSEYKSLRGSLYIVFVSKDNYRMKRKGFKALFQEEMCGQDISVGEEISSLTFPPANYPLSVAVTCKWRLYSKSGENKILVSFSNAYLLEPSSKIRVHDGSGEIKEFYNSPNQMYMSAGRKLDIELISDGTAPVVHFDMRYWNENAKGCDGSKAYLSANRYQKTLLSPGYPVRYPDYMRCVWQIQAESTTDIIKITVDVNDLENENCDDFISFFHGPVSDYSHPDLLLCGGETNIFYSKGSYATVHMYTDKHKGAKGFRIYYTTWSEDGVVVQQSTASVPIAGIVGGVLGAILFIVIVVLSYICIKRQCAATPPTGSAHPNSYVPEQTSPFLQSVTPPPAPAPVPAAAAPVPAAIPATAAHMPHLNPSAPPPSYEEMNTVNVDRSGPSAPPLPSLPPPSYEDAISKGMIRNSETGV